MKLTYVEKLPEMKCKPKKLQKLIEEFCESGREVAKIDFTEHEYKSPEVCYSCIWTAIKRSKRPVVIHIRKGEVYLTKI